jgi:hypothetical protein
MRDQASTATSRAGLRMLLLAGALAGAICWLTHGVHASFRIIAPTMSFVVLAGLGQILLGAIPRVGAALLGGVLCSLCAWIDPLFDGRIRLQPLAPLDLLSLFGCGLIAGYAGGEWLSTMFRMADDLSRLRGRPIYSVPRRFGMGTLLVATTLFAMLFAFLQWARARPEELFFYTAFVATVSVAQMVFERSPRWASVIAGGVYLPLSVLVIPMVRGRPLWRIYVTLNIFELVAIGLLVGYLGGALVAGIFLASDYLAKLVRKPAAPEPPAS